MTQCYSYWNMDELRAAFDPETFRSQGHALIDEISDYLKRTLNGEGPVHPWIEPEDRLRQWPSIDERAPQPLHVIRDFLRESQHIHHPGFVGHQNAMALPLSALADLTVSILNNSGAIYDMGPATVIIEKKVVEWMGRALGYGKNSDGFFTSGGTLGNLTAILAARQKKGGGDVWKEGTKEQFCFLVSEYAHYSIDRAVKIAGWGEKGIEKLPVDENFRIRLEALAPTLEKARKAGKKVLGIAINACSTATGTFDRLPEIADFTEKHGLWLHVDGAHGATTCLSEKYRGLLEGVERADSVVWDAHKMMLTPGLTTAVLFKRGDDSFETFAQIASYLFQKSAKDEWYNPCHRTLECTKRDFAFRLYLTLRCYGPDFFGNYITRQYDLARAFAEDIRQAKDFELPVEPQSNIICFRYTGRQKKTDLDGLQAQIRKAIIKTGKFYLTQTQLPKGVYLRTTLINPFTDRTSLRQLLEEVRAEAARL